MQETSIPPEIAKEEINELPLLRFEGPIHLVRDPEELAEHLTSLASCPFLGFDTETRPSFKKGQEFLPAVVQFASLEEAWVLQINQCGLSPILSILEDPQIHKVGIALNQDIRSLQKKESFTPAGFIDLADHARKAGIAKTGLRNLIAMFLRQRISKQAQVSNWAQTNLTPAQVSYAATDAWASLLLREKFLEHHIPL